jgi:hypothetical protein
MLKRQRHAQKSLHAHAQGGLVTDKGKKNSVYWGRPFALKISKMVGESKPDLNRVFLFRSVSQKIAPKVLSR